MSAYDNNPRVIASPTGRSFSVNVDATPAQLAEWPIPFYRKAVSRSEDGTWLAQGGISPYEWTSHATADDAIRSLIGEPR